MENVQTTLSYTRYTAKGGKRMFNNMEHYITVNGHEIPRTRHCLSCVPPSKGVTVYPSPSSHPRPHSYMEALKTRPIRRPALWFPLSSPSTPCSTRNTSLPLKEKRPCKTQQPPCLIGPFQMCRQCLYCLIAAPKPEERVPGASVGMWSLVVVLRSWPPAPCRAIVHLHSAHQYLP